MPFTTPSRILFAHSTLHPVCFSFCLTLCCVFVFLTFLPTHTLTPDEDFRCYLRRLSLGSNQPILIPGIETSAPLYWESCRNTLPASHRPKTLTLEAYWGPCPAEYREIIKDRLTLVGGGGRTHPPSSLESERHLPQEILVSTRSPLRNSWVCN